MKKAFIYFALAIFVLTSTELSEVFKIPFLFEHFNEHATENQKITFSEFIHIHYVNHHHDKKGHVKNDEEKDGKLPFHSHSDCNSLAVTYYFPIDQNETIPNYIISENSKKVKSYSIDEFLISKFIASIWQPPKIV